MAGTLQIGQVIGSYEVLKVIGDGHFGVVYLVRHQQTGKNLALKELTHLNPTYVTGFFRESTILQMTNFVAVSNIVRYIYQFEYNNIQFLVMEYAEGVSLADLSQGTISESILISIAAEVAKGLVVLHSNQPPIIHRDIKPDNVRFSIKGNVVKATILDLGIAALLDGIHKFGPGGSPRFAHPLQLKKGVAYHYMDQHSLGATLFYLMMSQISRIENELLLPFPFERWNGIAEQQAVMSSYPKAFQKLISDVHAGSTPYTWDAHALAKSSLSRTKFSGKLQDIILKMISYKETDQFASMYDAFLAFDALQGGQAQQPSIAQPGVSPVGKRVPTALLTNPPTIFMPTVAAQALPNPVLPVTKLPTQKSKSVPKPATAPQQRSALTTRIQLVMLIIATIIGLKLLGPAVAAIPYVTNSHINDQVVAPTNPPLPTLMPTDQPLPTLAPTLKPVPVKLLGSYVKVFLDMHFGEPNSLGTPPSRYAVWSPDSTQVGVLQDHSDWTWEMSNLINIYSGEVVQLSDVELYEQKSPISNANWVTPLEYVLRTDQVPTEAEMHLVNEKIPPPQNEQTYGPEMYMEDFSGKYGDGRMLSPIVLSWDKKHIAFITDQHNLYVADVQWDPNQNRYVLASS